MNWTIRYHRTATSAIYRIERGTAADVTEAIRRLAANPWLVEGEPIPERPNSFVMEAAGHLVAYRIVEVERAIDVLWIE
jgi:hypothetical protein